MFNVRKDIRHVPRFAHKGEANTDGHADMLTRQN